MDFEKLKLSNQLCFPVYAASRLITREYLPHLERLGITYPQYLVLLVLWENNGLTVNEIAQKLILQTNTITPLLQRMEAMGIIRRSRSNADERKVLVELTEKGQDMKLEAIKIPEKLIAGLAAGTMKVEELVLLREKLNQLIAYLSEKGGT